MPNVSEHTKDDPGTQPYDWHPRECVRSLDEIDYGFEMDGNRHQKQLGPPIVLDLFGGWATLIIPVFRDVGIGKVGSVTSRLEWHLDRWRLRHGVWRRMSTFVLRAHQLEALCGSWWTGELAPYQGIADDYKALKAASGVSRKVRLIPWWSLQPDDHLESDEYGDLDTPSGL
jgi:hypothetical protein